MNLSQRRFLILLIAAYLVLAIVYALATPPLEASDEYKHYPVVQHIQTQRQLPVLDPEDPGRWLQAAAQPPLYYVFMAGLTSWIDTSNLEEVHQVNPHAYVGNTNKLVNKNLIIHQPEQETFPWHGAVLAIYVIRLASILLGVGTILLTFRIGSLLFDPVVGLLAAALVGFNPMFLFVSAAVNNDSLATLLAHLGLLLLVRLWREAPDPARYWSRYAALGLVLGLGMLTKLSLGGLLLLAGIALAWQAWRRRQWRYLFLGGGVVLIVSLLLLSPWLLRNLNTYGDPTALDVFIQVQDSREEPLTLAVWRGEFGTLYRSFWGLFGGVNIAAPEWVYWLFNLIAVAGTASFAYWVWGQWRGRRERSIDQATPLDRPPYDGLWLLLAWPLIIMLLLIRWNFFAPSFQGRLLFPAIGAITVIWSVGLLGLVRSRYRTRLAMAVGLTTLAIAALLPWLVIRPAYAFPEPITAVPESARFGPIMFQSDDGLLQLVGVEVPADQSTVPRGDPIRVTLYWQALEAVEGDYLSAVHLLGRDDISVGQVNRYPGGGMVPTSLWLPGQIWRDEYRIRASRQAQAPTRLSIKVSLYDPDLKEDLVAVGPDGEAIDSLIVGQARLAPRRQTSESPEVELDIAFEEGIVLDGYDLTANEENALTVRLFWSAEERPSADYTVFLHLVDAAGEQVANGDGPPVNGDYPTSLWRDGDVIIDEHHLELPGGQAQDQLRITVGLYNPLDLARLSRLDSEGDSVSWPLVLDGDNLGN